MTSPALATLPPSIDVPTPVSKVLPLPEGTVRKMSARRMATGVLGRVLHPKHLWTAAGLHRHRKANRRAFDDTRLELYSRILPSDFLHYGYFEDVELKPERVSLDALAAAQARYAELLLELVGPNASPVLDIGCGMGGLTRMLHARGHDPVALTPDRLQAAYVAKHVPDVQVIRSKLEKLDADAHAGRYASVVTAESLQYLKLDQALPILQKILRPGGSWVACDYFKTQTTADATCHHFDTFAERVVADGWRIVYQRDVTAHVLPTLAFIHMLATRFGLPLMDFAVLRLRRKQPALHHLLGSLIDQLGGVANDNVGLINPTQFARDRQYMLLKLERA